MRLRSSAHHNLLFLGFGCGLSILPIEGALLLLKALKENCLMIFKVKQTKRLFGTWLERHLSTYILAHSLICALGKLVELAERIIGVVGRQALDGEALEVLVR